MSSVRLLDKTRKIGSFLHNNSSGKVVFSDICQVMAELLDSTVLVISKKGKLLGIGNAGQKEFAHSLLPKKVGEMTSPELNERFLAVLSTKENVNLRLLGIETEKEKQALVCPIYIAGERFGTVFICRNKEEYDIDDVIVCEYGATVVGLEMLRAEDEEDAELLRREQSILMALDVLSHMEKVATRLILNELTGKEGILVTSKIADREGMTRSVIVNALRKLESAGIIETHSLGMKGTFVRVLNDAIYDVMKKMEEDIAEKQ